MPVKAPEFQKLGVQVLDLSIDNRSTTRFDRKMSHPKMVEDGVPCSMLLNQTSAIGKMYGVYDENEGVDIRSRFLIDPEGGIQAMETLAPVGGRNLRELSRRVPEYEDARKTEGSEATPHGRLHGLRWTAAATVVIFDIYLRL